MIKEIMGPDGENLRGLPYVKSREMRYKNDYYCNCNKFSDEMPITLKIILVCFVLGMFIWMAYNSESLMPLLSSIQPF